MNITITAPAPETETPNASIASFGATKRRNVPVAVKSKATVPVARKYAMDLRYSTAASDAVGA